jgi:hypothetical protein
LMAATSEFMGVLGSQPAIAGAFYQSEMDSFNSGGLEGIAVNTAEWVVGSKVLGSIGGRVGGSIGAAINKHVFSRQLMNAAKESSAGLYNSLLGGAKTISKDSNFKFNLGQETTLTEDITFGRYFDDVSSFKEGNWLTTLETTDSGLARTMLNLDASGNQATKYATATIPKGSVVQAGFTENGAIQIYVSDADKSKIAWGETKDLVRKVSKPN